MDYQPFIDSYKTTAPSKVPLAKHFSSQVDELLSKAKTGYNQDLPENELASLFFNNHDNIKLLFHTRTAQKNKLPTNWTFRINKQLVLDFIKYLNDIFYLKNYSDIKTYVKSLTVNDLSAIETLGYFKNIESIIQFIDEANKSFFLDKDYGKDSTYNLDIKVICILLWNDLKYKDMLELNKSDIHKHNNNSGYSITIGNRIKPISEFEYSYLKSYAITNKIQVSPKQTIELCDSSKLFRATKSKNINDRAIIERVAYFNKKAANAGFCFFLDSAAIKMSSFCYTLYKTLNGDYSQCFAEIIKMKNCSRMYASDLRIAFKMWLNLFYPEVDTTKF